MLASLAPALDSGAVTKHLQLLALHRNPFCGLPEDGPDKGHGSEHLAGLWRPYIETCIEAFGPDRAMFESNYPVDRWGASYPVLWNAFKKIAERFTENERTAMFRSNAERIYRLDPPT